MAATCSTRSTNTRTDIVFTALFGFVKGLLLWAVLATALLWRLARRAGTAWSIMLRRVARFETELPWRTVLTTLLVILLLIGVSWELGTLYHLLGTDKVGEDVFYQALKSIRTGLLDRHPDHPGDAAGSDPAGHHGGLFPRLGG